LENLKKEIQECCKNCGRDPKEVRLIAVSKTQPLEALREALMSGHRIFGENYVQEWLQKWEQLENAQPEWHFIGPLQTNKVRKLIGKVEMIHSLDRLSLLSEISRQAELHQIQQKVLIQVNVASEESKSGISEQELFPLVEATLKSPGVVLCGLMTMPPFVEEAEENRNHFRKLKNIFDEVRRKFFNNELRGSFSELSMGTSQDFQVAIEEGATLVRVGTQVFGPRE
tara:strand:+ start:457 stop:1137 length:681 start_codon:yes stop_codon:yes gene_type:complete